MQEVNASEREKGTQDVRIVKYREDEYMRLLREGYEIVDRNDKDGERVMRKPKLVPFGYEKLD